jgi:hypothetical protein
VRGKGEREGREGKEGKRKWKKEKEKQKEREKEREMAKIAAVIATGGRAWATGSRAARDGTAVKKKREGYGRQKKEKKRWNDDWDGENFWEGIRVRVK